MTATRRCGKSRMALSRRSCCGVGVVAISTRAFGVQRLVAAFRAKVDSSGDKSADNAPHSEEVLSYDRIYRFQQVLAHQIGLVLPGITLMLPFSSTVPA